MSKSSPSPPLPSQQSPIRAPQNHQTEHDRLITSLIQRSTNALAAAALRLLGRLLLRLDGGGLGLAAPLGLGSRLFLLFRLFFLGLRAGLDDLLGPAALSGRLLRLDIFLSFLLLRPGARFNNLLGSTTTPGGRLLWISLLFALGLGLDGCLGFPGSGLLGRGLLLLCILLLNLCCRPTTLALNRSGLLVLVVLVLDLRRGSGLLDAFLRLLLFLVVISGGSGRLAVSLLGLFGRSLLLAQMSVYARRG